MSVVLENYFDPNYEPTKQEIEDYGKWLDLKLPEDSHLLWIARDGLKAPLPENWKACKSEKGELYYFNFRTGQSIWDHPCDEQFKQLVKTERAKHAERSAQAATAEPEAAASIPGSSKPEGRKERKSVTLLVDDAPEVHPAKKAEQPRGLAAKKADSSGPPAASADDAGAKEYRDSKKEAEAVTAKEAPAAAAAATDSPSAGEESDARKGTKLAQLKVLKRGAAAGMGRKPTVSFGSNDAPSVEVAHHNAPHSGTELAPVLKRKEPPPNAADLPRSPSPTPSASPTPSTGPPKETSDKNGKVEADKQRTFQEERQAAEAAFDSMLKQAKEQLAANHNRKVDLASKEFERKLESHREQCNQKLQAAIGDVTKEYELKLSAAKAEAEASCEAELRKFRTQQAEGMRATQAAEMEALRRSFDAKMEAVRKVQTAELNEATKSLAGLDCTALARAAQEAREAVGQSLASYSDGVRAAFLALFTDLEATAGKELKETSARRIAQLARETEIEIEHERQQARAAAERYRADVEQKYDAERSLSEERLRLLRENHEAERRRERESHEASMLDLRSANQNEKLRLEADHRQELESMRAAHVKAVQALVQAQAAQPAAPPKSSAVRTASNPIRIAPTSDGESDVGEEAHEAQFGESDPPTNVAVASSSTRLAVTKESSDLRAAVLDVLRNVLQLPLPASALGTGDCRAKDHQQGKLAGPSRLALTDLSNQTQSWKALDAAGATSPGLVYPCCFREQQSLLAQEQRRVAEATDFLREQRRVLDERRMKLKEARRHWKKDVLEAKARGATSGSSQALLLRKIHRVLDQQALDLAQDEDVLRDSERWVEIKSSRISALQQELESKGDCDLSVLSVDTQQLLSPWSQGEPVPPAPRRRVAHAPRHKSALKPSNEAARSAQEGDDAQGKGQRPNSAIDRIESRLDVMTKLLVAGAGSFQPSLGESSKAAARRSVSRSARHRSSSGTRHVDFAAAYPVGLSAAWA